MTLFLEEYQIVPAIRPVDLQTGANNGDWVSLKNASKVIAFFHSAIGTAGDDPTVTVNQATAVAGTSSKALNIDSDKVFKKQAATSLASTGSWAAGATVATNTWTDTDSAEQETLVAIEILAAELDADNDFDCVQITVADVGSNAQLGAAYYLVKMTRQAAPADVPSVIAD